MPVAVRRVWGLVPGERLLAVARSDGDVIVLYRTSVVEAALSALDDSVVRAA